MIKVKGREERTICGAMLFDSNDEKRILMKELLIEFNNKVRFTVDEGVLTYEHNWEGKIN